MKAIKINEEIKVYSELPNSWKGVMGNFSMLSEEEINTHAYEWNESTGAWDKVAR